MTIKSFTTLWDGFCNGSPSVCNSSEVFSAHLFKYCAYSRAFEQIFTTPPHFGHDGQIFYIPCLTVFLISWKFSTLLFPYNMVLTVFKLCNMFSWSTLLGELVNNWHRERERGGREERERSTFPFLKCATKRAKGYAFRIRSLQAFLNGSGLRAKKKHTINTIAPI